MDLFAAVWLGLAVVLVSIEVAGRFGWLGLAPLGAVLAALRRHRPGLGVLLVGWMWLGWHVFAR